MQRVSFTKNIDMPKLEHCRKSVVGANVWDKYEERGRLEWVWIGDEDLPFENILSDPKSVSKVSERMMADGRFVFTYLNFKIPDRIRWAIEKFELRRRPFLGPVFGYRAEMSLPDGSDAKVYLVSRGLSDINTKIFGCAVQNLDTNFLEEADSIRILSSW